MIINYGIEDFHRFYGKGFCKVLVGKTYVPAYVKAAVAGVVSLALPKSKHHPANLSINFDEVTTSLQVVWPNKRVFNFGGQALMLSRVPAKHYWRLPSSANVALKSVVISNTHYYWNPPKLTLQIWSALLGSNPVKFEDAMTRVNRATVLSVALTEHYTISTLVNGCHNLYYMDQQIGEIRKDGGYQVRPINKQFSEDVRDFMRIVGFPGEYYEVWK